jgi:hypothetical protein
MTKRPAVGRGLFYTRDSEGHSEIAPREYVAWAIREAAKLDVSFSGKPEAMLSMIARNVSAEGDLYVDYGVSGNLLSRPGFDAFRYRALNDPSVSHLFVPRRDRIARPDSPIEALAIEYELRAAGLTIVMLDKNLPPLSRGKRIDLADTLIGILDYDYSGKFRTDLAQKLILAKIRLARDGFSIGGEPVYGFRRWLCSTDGIAKRELAEREIVKMPGHHVVWLPTADQQLQVARRIMDLIESTPAARIARIFNAEGIPSPKAGRTQRLNGIKVANSGLWTQNTIKNIATNSLYIALWQYGKRAMGDQLRFTPEGPRPLTDDDYRADGKPKTRINEIENTITTAAKFAPIISPERQAKIRDILNARGKHLKGKTRTRGDAPNPLGGRIYDLNCGWPMYRYARRGKWCYTCALYQNSESKVCNHNVVSGLAATRFVLHCLRQRVLSPSAMTKLKARLRQFALAEQGDDPTKRQLEADTSELAAVRRKLQTVSRNMALAETPAEREATAIVFRELSAEVTRLENRIREAKPVTVAANPEEEVEAALSRLNRLSNLAELPDTNFGTANELFRQVNARLYLRFREINAGRRKFNVAAGGILTFGSTPPPIPLYDGATDRAIIRKMMADGLSVSPVLGHCASEPSDASTEVRGSANVQRGTCRFSVPRLVSERTIRTPRLRMRPDRVGWRRLHGQSRANLSGKRPVPTCTHRFVLACLRTGTPSEAFPL